MSIQGGMPHDLRVAIRDLVDDLAMNVIDVLRSASPAELHETRKTSRPTRTVPFVHRPVRRPRKHPGKKDVVGADTLLDEMLDALRASPKGLRSEDLRAQLGADKETFRLIAREAVAADLVTTTGEKRATTFALK